MTRDEVPMAPAEEREPLVRAVGAVIHAAIRAGYLELNVSGGERLPRGGPVVYAQNHAGWFALDTFILGAAVGEAVGVSRTPYYAAHDVALAVPGLGSFLRRLGGVPASWFRNPERLPPSLQSLGICPEGVRGNCKPFWEAYRMKPWSRTFVKVAIVRDAPIVPVAVLGGEECLPVAWTVEAFKPLIGTIFGLPLVPFPLPSRWDVVFHEPVHVPFTGNRLRPDREYCADVARRIQATVQQTLDERARTRPLGRLSSFVADALAFPAAGASDSDGGGSRGSSRGPEG